MISEPFRVLFPLGPVTGFIGVAHWGWYYSGLIEKFSCNYHSLMMIQSFEAAFAAGFIMTAVPQDPSCNNVGNLTLRLPYFQDSRIPAL